MFPAGAWGMELAGIFLFFFASIMRLDLGARSNRTEHPMGMLIFAIFSFFSLGFYVYFGLYTTFVLVIDIIFGMMGAFFVILEIILALIALISLNRK